MTACAACGQPTSMSRNKYCSTKCLAAHKRQKASRSCLCCCKTWYRKSISRRKPKGTANPQLHNSFCSKACAWKYKRYQADRKARCATCGKPTGQSEASKCAICVELVTDWSLLGEYAKCAHRAFTDEVGKWDKRIRSALVSLRIRQNTERRHQQTIRRSETWEDAITQARANLIHRANCRSQTQWDSKIRNAANLLGKRARRKPAREN